MSLANFAPDLRKPRDLDSMARALGISTNLFKSVIECDIPEDIYRLHKIIKRARPKEIIYPTNQAPADIGSTVFSGCNEYRNVWESISPPLKLAHKSACAAITSYLTRTITGFPHTNAYGYVRGRSTRDHAARHAGAYELLSADIKDFFPSISIGRVELALLNAGINRTVAGSLAKFLTIKGSLPLGLNSSPVIANLITHPLDMQFSALAEKRGLTYTRYADDITFSGAGNLLTFREIADILSAHQFELNDAKFRISRRGQRHYVTGLSVDDERWPHAPRRMKKRLRQELHFIRKFGLTGHLARLHGCATTQHHVNRIDGLVNYIASIEPRMAANLRSEWRKICIIEDVERSFEPRAYLKLREANWHVDEIEFQTPDGDKLLGLCCTDILEVEKIERKLRTLESEERGDAFATREFKLHWADMSISQREKAAKALATMPFRSVIVFDALEAKNYESTYCRLLSDALDSVMRSADDALSTLIVESNRSKVSETAIKRVVACTYDSLQRRNGRRPVRLPTTTLVAKGDALATFIPDALLGAFAAYVGGSSDRKALDAVIFERLRPRYSLIRDLRHDIAYTALHPFSGLDSK